MRLVYIPIAVAALLLGLAIGLVARGERVEDIPRRTSQIAQGMPDSIASESMGTKPAPRPTTFAKGAVKVAGLMSHRALARGGEYGEELAFFGTFAKTRVALELDFARVKGTGSRHIVSLVTDSSTVARFTDDQGTDFLAEADDPYEMMPRISHDGLGLQTVVASKLSPHPNATRVIVEGTLDILCASEKITHTSDEVALEVGTTFSVGPYDFEISSTGPSDWDPEKWNLELKTTGSVDTVISWTMVDAEGELLPLDESMTWTMNDTIQKTLVAPHAVERGSLRLEMWADGEIITVPYSVSTGVGLQ